MTSEASSRPRSIAWEVTQADIDSYGALCGANDPLHVNPEFARNTPFGGTIAQGLLIFGRLCAIIEGTKHCITGNANVAVAFKAPGRPGDRVTLESTPHATNDSDGAVYDIVWRRQDGVVVASGTIRLPGKMEV